MGVLTLFGSTSTLFCCALPALLAAVAGGSAAVALFSAFPSLIPLSRYKAWLFLAAGVLILTSGLVTLRPKSELACALMGERDCAVAGGFAKACFWSSLVLYGLGMFFAYAAVPILRFVG